MVLFIAWGGIGATPMWAHESVGEHLATLGSNHLEPMHVIALICACLHAIQSWVSLVEVGHWANPLGIGRPPLMSGPSSFGVVALGMYGNMGMKPPSPIEHQHMHGGSNNPCDASFEPLILHQLWFNGGETWECVSWPLLWIGEVALVGPHQLTCSLEHHSTSLRYHILVCMHMYEMLWWCMQDIMQSMKERDESTR
jgi:hypothetical protein